MMKDILKLSIIVCTYNRVSELKRVLEELRAQINRAVEFSAHLQLNDIEVIIVDNNSTDDTAIVMAEFINEGDALSTILRYELALDQGSSAARNHGVRVSKGNLLSFLDDDITLSDSWLVELYNLADTNPEGVAFGSRVIPLWEGGAAPKWLNLEPPYEVIQSAFPSHDYGDEAKVYPFKFGNRVVSNAIAANLTVSRDIFFKIGDFRLDLGITADTRGACEDSEFCWRIISSGSKLIYYPNLIIYHPIPKARMSKEFLFKWYTLLGKTLKYIKDNRLDHLTKDAKPEGFKAKLISMISSIKIGEISLFTAVKLVIIPVLSFVAKLQGKKTKAFWLDCQLKKAQGEL